MKKQIIKLWQIIFIFIVWLAAMFLPATVNQLKLDTNFDLAKSHENYFYYLWVQKPVTTVILILLLLGTLVTYLQKRKMALFFSFGFLLLYIYDLFLEVVLGRIFVGVSLKTALSSETFVGLWRTLGFGFFFTSCLGSLFAILLFIYISDGFMITKKNQDL
jgi:hypothetical protein